jgi:hypothetical protein
MSMQPDAAPDEFPDILARLAISPIPEPPPYVANVAELIDVVATAFPKDWARIRRLLANYVLSMYAHHA